ncbi:MAG: D-ala-D-ala dipeptidase family protein [Candidatus Peribacteria bacterium]|nr:D-ala-D-ala dipeptidase family protein [Candidatus Peribacteria bacterium]
MNTDANAFIGSKATYMQLIGVHVEDNNEMFICITPDVFPSAYMPGMKDMQGLFPGIPLRTSVFNRLRNARRIVKSQRPDLDLLLTYGYRTLEIQTELFVKELEIEKMNTNNAQSHVDENELYEKIHRRIAVPLVAGHPTGGAVDVTLITKAGKMIDMGSAIYDFAAHTEPTFSVTGVALAHRILLRNAMAEAGFIPFDFEYWHFSYGDREWAYMAASSHAIFSQKSLHEVQSMM